MWSLLWVVTSSLTTKDIPHYYRKFTRESAVLSTAVYSVDSERLITSDITDCNCMFFKGGDADYLVFRGSDTWKDWIINMLFRFQTTRIGHSNCSAHSGFVWQWQSVEDRVHRVLGARRHDKPLIVTGHSLGGAVAQIAAFDLKSSHGMRVICISFGAPRTFTSIGSKAFNSAAVENIRVCETVDPVTHIPFIRMTHVGDAYAPSEVHGPWWALWWSIAFHDMHRYMVMVLTL